MVRGTLRSQIDKVWEAFWTGGISNPMTVIEQFTFLLFLRRLDEQQLANEKQAQFSGTPPTNLFYSAKHKQYRWSSFKDKDPETSLNCSSNLLPMV